VLLHKSIDVVRQTAEQCDGDDTALCGYAQLDISETRELEHLINLLSIQIYFSERSIFEVIFAVGRALESVTVNWHILLRSELKV